MDLKGEELERIKVYKPNIYPFSPSILTDDQDSPNAGEMAGC